MKRLCPLCSGNLKAYEREEEVDINFNTGRLESKVYYGECDKCKTSYSWVEVYQFIGLKKVTKLDS